MEASKNNNKRMRSALIRLGAVGGVATILVGTWQYSSLNQWSDPDRVAAMLDSLGASPWAGPIVVGAFLLGSFLVFPVTGMIAATGVVLGPRDGLLWASVGSLVAATVTYGLARMVPEQTLDRWIGSWVSRMGKRFGRSGIVSVMVARNLPIAPFTLINVVAGAAKIPYRDFIIGTCLGMGPVIAALTILGDRLRGAWESPTVLNIVLLCVAIASWFLLAMSLQALSNRWMAARQRNLARRNPGPRT